MRLATTILILLIAAPAWLTVALAQDAEPPRKEKQEKKAAPERDPFSETAETRRRARGTEFVAQDRPDLLPALALKGYAEDKDGQAVALLEVGGKTTYLVRKGDTVSLPEKGTSQVLKVVEISNLELRVEVGELRRVVIVR